MSPNDTSVKSGKRDTMLNIQEDNFKIKAIKSPTIETPKTE